MDARRDNTVSAIPDYFALYVEKDIGERAKRPHGSVSPRYLSEVEAAIAPLVVLAAGVIAYVTYFSASSVAAAALSSYLGTAALVALISHFIFVQRNIHDVSHFFDGRLAIRQIVLAVSTSFLVVICLFYLLNIAHQLSRGWFVTWYVTTVVGVSLVRAGLVLWAQKLIFETRLFQNVAIYGREDLARKVMQHLLHETSARLNAAFFSDDPQGDWPVALAVAGGMDHLIHCAQAGDCDRIILALPQDDAEIHLVLDRLAVLPVEVQLCPDALAVTRQAHGSRVESGLLLLDLQQRPFSDKGTLAKVILDYTLAFVGIVLLAPLMALIALAIKLDSRSPVFFVQSRHGYNNQIISVFKFRTMTSADDGPVVPQVVRNDKRVTRVGRLLRRTSLDELPQLFNVLRGELSIVGPRPHAVSHNEIYAASLASYTNRHKVKPGMTGWAQVNGFRGLTETQDSMRKRLDLDLFYINHWSFWLDLKILVWTVAIPFSGKNAY